MLALCDERMRVLGFRYVKGREAYTRRFANGLQSLTLRILAVGGTPRVEFAAAVRMDEVEAVYHRILNTPAKYAKLTNSLWIPAEALSGWPREECQIGIREDSDIERAAKKILEFVEVYAEPYWREHETLAAVSTELNSRPEEPTPHCAPPARAFYGLIVAAMLGEQRWKELVTAHRAATSKIDRGFHNESLERLIAELEAEMVKK